MKPFSVCFLLLPLVAYASGSPSASHAKWSDFKAKHAKSHPAHEDGERMSRFLALDAEIAAHNEKYARGEVSYSRQHSRYSDLTKEQFARAALGLSFPANFNASAVPIVEAPPMGDIPANYDLRSTGTITGAKDQAYCGSCYAFAVAGAMESLLLRKKMVQGGVPDLSEQDIVDCSYQTIYEPEVGGYMNGGCSGGWPTSTFTYYNKKDLVFEQEYPYVSGRSNSHYQCRARGPIRNSIMGHVRAAHVNVANENDLRAVLMQKGALAMGIAADGEQKNLFKDLGNGIFDEPYTSQIQPNHAVMLIGWGTENGKDFWIIKNSWGSGWGVNGFGKIARGKNMANIMTGGFWSVDYV